MTAPLTVVQPAIVVPEPGLYPDVPAAVYHRWPAASQRAAERTLAMLEAEWER